MSRSLSDRLTAMETTNAFVLDHLKRQTDTLDKMNARLGSLETQGAKHGAIAGGIMSVGIAFIAAKLKGQA